MLPREKLLRQPSGLLGIALIGDVVAFENASRAVTRDLHDHGLRNRESSKADVVT